MNVYTVLTENDTVEEMIEISSLLRDAGVQSVTIGFHTRIITIEWNGDIEVLRALPGVRRIDQAQEVQAI